MTIFNKPTTVNQVWASSGILQTPTSLKINQGWTVEVPPYQWFNWSQNRTDSFIAHVNQHGISRWDSSTTYYPNRSYAQGSDGVVYKAIQQNTNIDPANPLNAAYWVQAFEVHGSVAAVQNQLNTLQTNYSTLAGIDNVPQARTNLSVYSKTESDARYPLKTGSASQTFSVAPATAPSHAVPLSQISGLIQTATTTEAGISRFATTLEQEQGTLGNVSTSPLAAEATYLKKSRNLSDIPSKSIARQNLGLGAVATLSIGTTSGTVAAGDDSRIVNAVPNTRHVIAGNGLIGGGSLTENRAVSLGTPTTLNSGSGNTVTSTSHSHSIDINSFFSDRGTGDNGWIALPGGIIFQWGVHNMNGGSFQQTVGFHKNWSATLNIQLTNLENSTFEAAGTARVLSYNSGGFSFLNSNTNTFTAYFWFAVGRA